MKSVTQPICISPGSKKRHLCILQHSSHALDKSCFGAALKIKSFSYLNPDLETEAAASSHPDGSVPESVEVNTCIRRRNGLSRMMRRERDGGLGGETQGSLRRPESELTEIKLEILRHEKGLERKERFCCGGGKHAKYVAEQTRYEGFSLRERDLSRLEMHKAFKQAKRSIQTDRRSFPLVKETS